MPPSIDLTAPITASPAELPEPLRTDIPVQDHAAGAWHDNAIVGGEAGGSAGPTRAVAIVAD